MPNACEIDVNTTSLAWVETGNYVHDAVPPPTSFFYATLLHVARMLPPLLSFLAFALASNHDWLHLHAGVLRFTDLTPALPSAAHYLVASTALGKLHLGISVMIPAATNTSG